MKEENIKNDKEKEIEENLSETDKTEYNSWIVLIILIIIMFDFSNKKKCSCYKPERSEIINFVNNSDLSNTDKKQIIDILLK